MAQIKKISLCVLLIVMAVLSCVPLQKPTVVPVSTDTPTLVPSLKPSSTLTLTSTLTPTGIPSPTATSTQPAEETGPFRRLTSLAGLLKDPTSEVQLRVLADGKVWVITSQLALRWDGQEWEVVLSSSKEMQAAVDDGGRLWVLYQDISEISAWQGGDWILYGAGRGWESVGAFEVNGWAPAPWRIYRSKSGMLWAPMEQDVRMFDGNRWNLYSLEDMSFPHQDDVDISIVHNLAMVQGGAEVWVGECYYSGPGPMGGGGVRWFDGKSWQGADALLGATCVSALEVDPAGDVWLGAYDIVWRYEHASQSWTDNRLPKALLSGYNFAYPLQLKVDKNGDVWVIMQMCGGASCSGTTNLYRIHDKEWSFIIASENWGTPLKQIALDGEGQAWLFWDGIIYRLDDQPLRTFASITALGVDTSPDGNIWVVAVSGDEASLQVLVP
jgi:hypothetical protein